MTQKQTPKTITTYRIRRFLDRQFVIVAVILLALVVLGGGVLYQNYANPPTATEEEVFTEWTEETALFHQAEVVRPSMVFESNQTLTNQQVYFTSLSPTFEGVHEYSYRTELAGELQVESTATLNIRAVDSADSIYWEYTEPLASEITEVVSPGQTVTTPVSINVTTLDATIANIEADIGSNIGTTEILIVYETRLVGTIDDGQVANAHTDTIRVVPDGGSYSVEVSDGTQVTHANTVSTTEEQPIGPFRSFGPVGLIFGSTVGLLGLTAAKFRNRLALTSEELRSLEGHEQRRAFDDWISTARVPDPALTGIEIQVDSLTDLVDIAIDTNQRVLEDTSREAFYVVSDYGHYVFSPAPELTNSATPMGTPEDRTQEIDSEPENTDVTAVESEGHVD